jgi:hypothetical protein
MVVCKRCPMPLCLCLLIIQSGVLALRIVVLESPSRIVHRVHVFCPFTYQGSHLPSFHPVLHRSSHLVQSNVSLPSFSLTALCASHIHVPNSLLLETLGVFLVIQVWKSSAQTQHGYSFPNVERKDLVSDWSCGVGCVG